MRIKPLDYKVYSRSNFETIPQVRRLSSPHISAMKAVSMVLPFRVNNYVVDNLIDWKNIPEDPLFQLSFPQEEMLSHKHFTTLYRLIRLGADAETINQTIAAIHADLNPHPAGQVNLNVPFLNGEPLHGLQHKYRETVLFFPTQGQTCHAYCTYCFRWAQFAGKSNFKFAEKEVGILEKYLRAHTEVKDVLITGGDPMIMRTNILRRYVEPLLKIPSLHTVRIGTKSVAWWPYRFVSDPDTDDLLKLFEDVVRARKNMALMAHYSHPRELSTPVAQLAVRRIRSTGAILRCQAPLIRHVNDDPNLWASLWQREVNLGAVPYYMFIERNTGPKNYFEVPLAQAYDIYSKAFRQLSGLGRTVRGPVLSCTPGKVWIQGISEIDGKKVFVLNFLQGRNPNWTNHVFFARYDESAHWIDDLRPAFEPEFFYEEELESICQNAFDRHPPGVRTGLTQKKRKVG